jgi:hypothetical protein
MDTDEPITLVDLRQHYIDKQFRSIIRGVYETCGSGYTLHKADINEPFQDIIVELLKKKLPECKITVGPKVREPGLSPLIFSETSIHYRGPIPKSYTITIDWSGSN